MHQHYVGSNFAMQIFILINRQYVFCIHQLRHRKSYHMDYAVQVVQMANPKGE